eukprot:1156944-Pelagomonas_calceolata.AAC.3
MEVMRLDDQPTGSYARQPSTTLSGGGSEASLPDAQRRAQGGAANNASSSNGNNSHAQLVGAQDFGVTLIGRRKEGWPMLAAAKAAAGMPSWWARVMVWTMGIQRVIKMGMFRGMVQAVGVFRGMVWTMGMFRRVRTTGTLIKQGNPGSMKGLSRMFVRLRGARSLQSLGIVKGMKTTGCMQCWACLLLFVPRLLQADRVDVLTAACTAAQRERAALQQILESKVRLGGIGLI